MQAAEVAECAHVRTDVDFRSLTALHTAPRWLWRALVAARLANMRQATRIRDRAIRRCGELLKQIEPGQGARDGKREVGDRPPLRKEVARDAGITPHQAKQAIRVANVPAEDFERQVESVCSIGY